MEGHLKLLYEERAKLAENPAAQKLFGLMAQKKTNLAFLDDACEPEKFLYLADLMGPEIALLKTHIDIIENFSSAITQKLSELAKKHNFMIFEDRKFADIGNTVQLQYSRGIYRICDWAHIVNAHLISGPEIMDALWGAAKAKSNEDKMARGILVLAQMSSAGTLATGDYTKKCVEIANSKKEAVAGYIGTGSDPSELRKLSSISFCGHAILTPGIQLESKSDNLGQRYAPPKEAIMAGSDCILVGRGIYMAQNPLEEAKKYRRAGWSAYLERITQL